MILTPEQWKDFELLDSGDGAKLERWGEVILSRPDPQAIWPRSDPKAWHRAQATYHRDEKGGGRWEMKKPLPSRWEMAYGPWRFHVRPTDFKHTGLFPEQGVNWEWMSEAVKAAGRPIQALNLFGYTGAATVALASAGAVVAHVDSAKGMVEWCKDNATLNNLRDKPVRYLVDDVTKFVERELRREHRFDAIVMDPPSFGRGKSGETWKIEKHLWPLLQKCAQLLSKQPLFILLNSYTAGYSPTVMENMLKAMMKGKGGKTTSGELGLRQTSDKKILPCGIYARWEL